MPVVSVGQKLPSIYLDRFQPVEGLTYRLSVLHTDAIATEFHFIDIPSRGIKGTYQCIQGSCCAAFGRRSQTYNVPVYVYQNPSQTTEGEVQVWRMTAPQWKKFSDMAVMGDFLHYDIMLVAQKRGYGLDLSYSVVPDVKLRDYWSAEQKEQIPQAVASFYQLGEASLVDPMTFNDWNQLLYDCGFDLQNMQWPGGQSPMSSVGARRSIGGAVSPPALAMMPSVGVLPPVPGTSGFIQPMPSMSISNTQASPVMQPPTPAPAQLPVMPQPVSITPQPVSVPPPGYSTVPQPVSVPPPGYSTVPQPVAQATQPVATVTPPDGLVPQQPKTIQFPATSAVPGSPVAQATAPTVEGVPLGVGPVIPQTAAKIPVMEQAQSLPNQVGNTIPGQQEITMEEMNQLLS
jgi:hypothetical protein